MEIRAVAGVVCGLCWIQLCNHRNGIGYKCVAILDLPMDKKLDFPSGHWNLSDPRTQFHQLDHGSIERLQVTVPVMSSSVVPASWRFSNGANTSLGPS